MTRHLHLTRISGHGSAFSAAAAATMSCLLVAGCASVGPKFQKVTASDRQYTFSDFAVKPPTGADWYVFQTPDEASAHLIIFYKKLPIHQYPATNSFYVLVQSELVTNTFDNPDQFQAFAEKWINEVDPERYKALEDCCTPDHRFGEYCVKFANKAQDYGAHIGGSVLILESAGYLFRHPKAPNRLVMITCSERVRSDELDPSLKLSAEEFIRKVELK